MAEEVKVLGVPRATLEAIYGSPLPNGVLPLDEGRRLRIFGDAVFRPRAAAEEDPSFKQLIPYVVFSAALDLVFVYGRGTGGGERRLASRLSVGVGGHVEGQDAGPDGAWQTYARGLRRELVEEVRFAHGWAESPLGFGLHGLINDDTEAVGSVHIGVLHAARIETFAEPPAGRPEIGLGGLVSASVLRLVSDRLESWSRIALDALYPPPAG